MKSFEQCLRAVIQASGRANDAALEAYRPPTTGVLGSQHALEEGENYYLEGESIVFTTSYLRKRGYCCQNGCRHCPY